MCFLDLYPGALPGAASSSQEPVQDPASPSPQQAAPTSIALIAGIVGAAAFCLILALVITVIVLLRRNKRLAEEASLNTVTLQSTGGTLDSAQTDQSHYTSVEAALAHTPVAYTAMPMPQNTDSHYDSMPAIGTLQTDDGYSPLNLKQQ